MQSCELLYYLFIIFLLQKRHYKYLGEFTVISITQGGLGMPIMAPALYDYIHTGKLSSCIDISLKDMPYPNVKYVLEKVTCLIVCWYFIGGILALIAV